MSGETGASAAHGFVGLRNLTKNRVTVGRTKASVLHVRDPGVSEKHAIFQWTGATWTVTDVGSSNGTIVNGDDLVVGVPRTLKSGDHVQLGLESAVRITIGPVEEANDAEQNHANNVAENGTEGAGARDVDEESVTVEAFLEAEAVRLATAIRERAMSHVATLRKQAQVAREQMQSNATVAVA